MSGLTEIEIFECLADNLRLAAQHCEELITAPYRGFVYDQFRQELRLVEGACRQAGYWRNGDARWLEIGMMIHEAHDRAGRWLRTMRSADSRKVSHPLFKKLAENLRALHKKAEDLRTKKTGRIGPILPTPQAAPLREGRPVQVAGFKRSSGGILVPAGTIVH